MQRLKKIFVLMLLTIFVTAATGTTHISAVHNDKRTEFEGTLNITKDDKEFYGKALKELGLLMGSENGLELEKPLTRVEGAVMYSRLLGVTNEIAEFKVANPEYKSGFTDVPDWAVPTINCLHSKGLCYGISDNKFGSASLMTKEQYVTFVLRALGYSDKNGDFTLPTAIEKAKEIGMFSNDTVSPDKALGSEFTRGSMSYVSYNALFFNNTKTGKMLIDSLEIEKEPDGEGASEHQPLDYAGGGVSSIHEQIQAYVDSLGDPTHDVISVYAYKANFVDGYYYIDFIVRNGTSETVEFTKFVKVFNSKGELQSFAVVSSHMEGFGALPAGQSRYIRVVTDRDDVVVDNPETTNLTVVEQ